MSAQALVSPLYRPRQHLYLVLIISCLFLVSFSFVYLTIIIQATSLSLWLHNDTAIRVPCTRAAAHRLHVRSLTEDISQVSHLVPCPKSSNSSKSASSSLWLPVGVRIDCVNLDIVATCGTQPPRLFATLLAFMRRRNPRQPNPVWGVPPALCTRSRIPRLNSYLGASG